MLWFTLASDGGKKVAHTAIHVAPMQPLYLNGGGDSVLGAKKLPHSQFRLHSRMQSICMVVRTYRQKGRRCHSPYDVMTSSVSSLVS